MRSKHSIPAAQPGPPPVYQTGRAWQNNGQNPPPPVPDPIPSRPPLEGQINPIGWAPRTLDRPNQGPGSPLAVYLDPNTNLWVASYGATLGPQTDEPNGNQYTAYYKNNPGQADDKTLVREEHEDDNNSQVSRVPKQVDTVLPDGRWAVATYSNDKQVGGLIDNADGSQTQMSAVWNPVTNLYDINLATYPSNGDLPTSEIRIASKSFSAENADRGGDVADALDQSHFWEWAAGAAALSGPEGPVLVEMTHPFAMQIGYFLGFVLGTTYSIDEITRDAEKTVDKHYSSDDLDIKSQPMDPLLGLEEPKKWDVYTTYTNPAPMDYVDGSAGPVTARDDKYSKDVFGGAVPSSTTFTDSTGSTTYNYNMTSIPVHDALFGLPDTLNVPPGSLVTIRNNKDGSGTITITDSDGGVKQWAVSQGLTRITRDDYKLEGIDPDLAELIGQGADDPIFNDPTPEALSDNGPASGLADAPASSQAAHDAYLNAIAISAQGYESFISGIKKGGIEGDLQAIAGGLQIASGLPNLSQASAAALVNDAQWIQQVENLAAALRRKGISGGFAAAQAAASLVAHGLNVNTVKGVPNLPAEAWSKAASALGDLAILTASGPGSLTKTLQDAEAGVDLLKLASTGKAAIALGNLAGGIGDVVGIIQGFEAGGLEGGIQAGFSADMLALLLGASGGVATPIAIVVGLISAIFGGNHTNPANTPDISDTARFGQEDADLAGYITANGHYFTERAGLVQEFGTRTGIAAIQEMLAQYGTVDNAPAWLKPIFNELYNMFGESTTATGYLHLGDSSGKNTNNEQVDGAQSGGGGNYQYTDLANALYDFATRYGNALVSGQAAAFSWVGPPPPSDAPPSDPGNPPTGGGGGYYG